VITTPDPLLINYAQNIAGYMSELECNILYAIAQTIKLNEIMVEIGSHQGKSTAVLGLGSKFNHQAKVYAIDLWDLDVDRHEPEYQNIKFYNKFIKNMNYLGLQDIVVPIKGSSIEVAKTWDKQIKMLLIDGGHRYEDVKQDFEAWLPFVVQGGKILFHDYSGQFVDIIKYVSSQESKTIDCITLVESLYVSKKL